MAENIKSIQYIRMNDGDYSFDAVTIGGKSVEEIGELVTSINGESTNNQYPSAKCIYEMIYGHESTPPRDYSQEYLTLDFIGEGSSVFNCSEESVYYSLDDGQTWNSFYNGYTYNPPTVTTGDKLMLKGAFRNNRIDSHFLISGNSFCPSFNVYGNLASLFYGDDFANKTTFPALNCDCEALFRSMKVISAENLILPFTTLTPECYSSMFDGCTYLTSAPALPATTLANSCYSYMFQDCTSLTTAPVLPATTLVDSCYVYMFRGCTGLTTSPDLPATTLVKSCYQNMFEGCSNLNYIKCLAVDVYADECTKNWVYGVAQSGTFVKDPYMTDLPYNDVNGIPQTEWYVLNYDDDMSNDEPVNLTGDYSQQYLTFEFISGGYSNSGSIKGPDGMYYSLDNGDHWGIFYDNINVSVGDKMLLKGNITNTLEYCSGLFEESGCPNLNAYGNIMSIYSRSNFTNITAFESTDTLSFTFKYLPIVSAENLILPATTLVDSCYTYMFEGCRSLTTAPALPATTLADSCYWGMFYDCTSLTTAPELLVETLVESCYSCMFTGCNNLNYIKCLATDISAYDCTGGWVYGVADTGTFVKADNMEDWPRDDSDGDGIPEGWTVIDNV